ncbi:AlpA family phage regulatory protein [Shewanella sp. 125m-7]
MSKTAATATFEDRLVREQERKSITGISRSTAWTLERKSLFPKRRELIPGGDEIAWSFTELMEWVHSRKVINLGEHHAK